MFRQYGVKSVSMDDISHRLAVSKKTLYKYFDNKEDLLLNGISKIFGRIFDEYYLISRSKPHPLAAITLFYYSILKEISRYESVYFYSINKYSETIRSAIEKQ
jgi:AcrR family transcriptional regulator